MLKASFLLFLVLSILISCTQSDPKIEKESVPALKINGEIYAHILDVNSSGSPYYIILDTINYFVGKEAVEEYMADTGKDLEEQTFYIRNTGRDSLKFHVSDKLKITPRTFDFSSNEQLKNATKFERFSAFLNSGSIAYISTLPFKIKISDNKVVLIEEIYIP